MKMLLAVLGVASSLLGPVQSAAAMPQKNVASNPPAAIQTEDPLAESRQAWQDSRAANGDDHPETLQLLQSHAIALNLAGKYAEAEPIAALLVARARTMLEPDDPALADRLNFHAIILDRMGRTASAQRLVDEQLRIFRKSFGNSDYRTLNSLTNNANLLFMLGRRQEAADLRADAWQLMRNKIGKGHPDTLRTLGQYATTLNALGKLSEAAPLYEQAWRDSQYELGTSHPVTMANFSNHALHLDRLGQTAKAEQLFSQVLRQMRDKWGEQHEAKITALDNYASIVKNLGRIAEATALHEEAASLAREHLGDQHPATLSSMNNLALALADQGKTIQAIEIYEKVVAARISRLGKNHPQTLATRANQASLLDQDGRTDQAEQISREVLAKSRELLGINHPDTIRFLNNLAGTISAKGQYEEAERLAVEAVVAARQVFGPDHFRTRYVEAHLVRIRLRSPDHGSTALTSARSVVAAVRRYREGVGFDPASSLQFSAQEENQRNYFRLLADAAWQHPDAVTEPAVREEVFAALQESISNSASRAVALAAARRTVEDVDSRLATLASRRVELGNQWLAADRAFVSSRADSDPDAAANRNRVEQERGRLASQISEIDIELRRRSPAYFSLIRPQPVSLQDAQQMMGEEDVALITVPGKFGTHVMAVTGDSLHWHRSDWTEDRVNGAVRRLLWDVGAKVEIDPATAADWDQEGEGAYPFDRKTAHQLYQELIAPISSALSGKRHLFISAGGSLSSLPFGLLVTGQPEGMDGDPDQLRNTGWLADDHALIQIASLQSLRFLRRYRGTEKASPDKAEFRGFGDPLLQGEATDRAQRNIGSETERRAMIDPAALKQLARLPGTAREIEALGTAFGVDRDAIYLGARATERNFRNADLSRTDILAIATHGLLAGEISGASEPGLVFTPPDEPSASDDGLLTSSEIATLQLGADWVILSACNTATGDASEGASGLSSLSRSFFYAGAANLLASHWPVRDAVAPLLTSRTVEIARDNPALSRAEAFQRAMQEIRNNRSADSATDSWAHPNAWAPFSLIGDR